MGNDIVVRLKRELEEIRRSGYGHDWPLSQAIAVIEAQQAEIQRLRAAGDALAEALDWNLSCPCNDEPLHGLDAEMNTRSLTAQRAWHEARRG